MHIIQRRFLIGNSVVLDPFVCRPWRSSNPLDLRPLWIFLYLLHQWLSWWSRNDDVRNFIDPTVHTTMPPSHFPPPHCLAFWYLRYKYRIDILIYVRTVTIYKLWIGPFHGVVVFTGSSHLRRSIPPRLANDVTNTLGEKNSLKHKIISFVVVMIITVTGWWRCPTLPPCVVLSSAMSRAKLTPSRKVGSRKCLTSLIETK